jgi:hypothetical protein
LAEHDFVMTYDIEYHVTIYDTKTFTCTAESLADAKRQAEEECREAEGGAYFYQDFGTKFPSGYEVDNADVEMDDLCDQDSGECYGSLGIEPGDEQPFTEEDEEDA